MTLSPDEKEGNQGAARTKGNTMTGMAWNIATTRLTRPLGRFIEKVL